MGSLVSIVFPTITLYLQACLFFKILFEPCVLLCAVHKEPREALAQEGREHRYAHNQEGIRPHDEE